MSTDLDELLGEGTQPRDEHGRFASQTEPEPKPEAEPEGEKPTEPAPEAEAKPEAQPEPTGEQPSAPPAEPKKRDDDHVPVTALQDERRKRQELERRLAELEAARNQPQRPDDLEDPEGAREYDRRQAEQASIDQKVNVSFLVAQRTIPDFKEVMQDWEELKGNDRRTAERIYAQAIHETDPAGFVYEQLKAQRALRDIGPDPVAYRTKLEQELRAKVKAELEAEQKAAQEQQNRASVPPSLAGERSTGSRASGPQHTGPTPLSELIPLNS